MMETLIWFNGGWRNIKPEEPVLTTKRIHSFCCFNCLRDAIFRSQGGWYYLTKSGHLEFVCRTLYEISFKDLYDILSKEKSES